MSISFDRVADVFDRTRGFPPPVMAKIAESLGKELESCENVLDVAAGTGRFAALLQDRDIKVVGIDISKKMLHKAVEKGTRNVIVADACLLPFKDSEFDASLCISTLHLIKEWKKALQEIVRVTKESLLTVLREGFDYRRTPRGLYRQLLEKSGISYSHPGVGLWDLKEILKPSKSAFVTSYHVSTQNHILFLDEKAYSYQWNVPDSVHKKVMKEVKEAFVTVNEHPCDVYLHKWDIDKVESYLKQ